jgi:diguanylate cyclase (GGDEF)-like protein
VAWRLSACVRASDTVARIGGDEMVVLLRDVDSTAHTLDVAEKIRASLAQAFDIGGHQLNISGSLGVALYPEHGQDADTLVKHADAAMYQAKDMGRDRVQLYLR